MLEGLAHVLGVKLQTMLAAMAGATTSMLFVRAVALVHRLGLWAGGFMSAVYGAEPLALWFGVPVRFETGVGFLLGFFAMSLADAIMRAISAADVWPIIKGWLGGKQ